MNHQRSATFPSIPAALMAAFLLGSCSVDKAPLPPPPPIAPQPAPPPASAAPAPEPPPVANVPAAAGSPVAELLKMLDSDGDGRISKAEHEERSRGMFETMDSDHDGKVTADEMDAMRRQYYGAKRSPAAREISRVDSDHDGMLSADEHATATGVEFDHMDGDHDGFLTATELEAANTAASGPASPTP